MNIDSQVFENINDRINSLRLLQKSNGSFEFCFEGSLLPDSFMLILMSDLEISDEVTSNLLSSRIISLQQPNGSWKLFEDEKDGNLNATVQSYVALLLSNRLPKDHPKMRKAEKYILENGGIEKTHFLTKMILAIHGFMSYPKFYFPMSYFLLPNNMPFSIFEFSNNARVHLIPMILCINKRFNILSTKYQSLDYLKSSKGIGWFREERGTFYEFLIKEGKKLAAFPFYFHKKGYEVCEQFILGRIETNGTFFTYASSTFYMIYALLALNYQKDDPIIMKAYRGLKSYICKTDSHYHLQNSPSTVWDTALLSYAIQEAGVALDDPFVSSSISYIISKQQTKKGDWAIHAKDVDPGGWGFSDINSFIPDNDDTSAALRAITRAALDNPVIQENWNKGVNYLIGLQNKDGGWGAFEKDVTSKWLTQLPIENAEDAITDPSTPDLTGRVLEFFGNYSTIPNDSEIVLNAMNWLLNSQEENGSWYGRWGICYLYGTWAAVTGLRAVGVAKDHPSIKKAEKWLLSIQNDDGGWGESCHSAVKKKFVPLKFSTPSQTAWAIDTLLTIRDRNDDAIQKGVNYLLNQSSLKEKELKYPTGLGLPGQFYIHYHSYNHIFPLLALSHYLVAGERD